MREPLERSEPTELREPQTLSESRRWREPQVMSEPSVTRESKSWSEPYRARKPNIVIAWLLLLSYALIIWIVVWVALHFGVR